MDVLTLLKNDHRMVSGLFDQVEDCEPGDPRLKALAEQIDQALTAHAAVEEKLFYPELRNRAEEDDERVDVYEAFTEHDVVKHLLRLLGSGRKAPEEFKAELQVLAESVKHHVREEESTIFALAREVLDDDELDAIGEKAEAAKARMMRRTAAPQSAAKPAAAKRTGAKRTAARRGSRKKETLRRKGK